MCYVSVERIGRRGGGRIRVEGECCDGKERIKRKEKKGIGNQSTCPLGLKKSKCKHDILT